MLRFGELKPNLGGSDILAGFLSAHTLFMILEMHIDPGLQGGTIPSKATKHAFLQAEIHFFYYCNSVFRWVNFVSKNSPCS